MNQSLLYLIVFMNSLLSAAIPFGVYMGAAMLLGITDPDSSQLLVYLFFATLLISYTSGLGSLSMIQYNSCGAVKNFRQIAGNAIISTIVTFIGLLLAVFVPGLKSVVTSLFSPVIDPNVTQSFGYAFFLFWGTMYGLVTSGLLVSQCG